MTDDLNNQIDALRRQIRGRGHTYEDLAIEAEVQRIKTAAATLVMNQLFQAHEVLVETGQRLLPAPVAPAPLQHQPRYDYVPPIEERYADEMPRFMNGRQRVA